ncbi:MAG TPA: peptidase M28, partial [Runella sp.]|nr:peptidase M28 [Runella sp.]
MKKILLVACLAAGSLYAQKSDISAKNVQKHISYLASDELKGRGTGTKEEKMSADYIAKYFKEIGL